MSTDHIPLWQQISGLTPEREASMSDDDRDTALEKLHEKYADKGLVIIGVTRYYNFDWDEKADKAISSREKVAPEKEQAMLVKFAAQHKLSHRFGIQKGNTLSRYYGVTGIPQAVVIDREETVRLIRVCSGDANAKDISELLNRASMVKMPMGHNYTGRHATWLQHFCNHFFNLLSG